MSVFGVSMMRDEADIAPYVVRHMLDRGCDEVIVVDHCSTDGTGELCAEAGAKVLIDLDQGYDQSGTMTRLARVAADQGADWIVPFDADEAWFGVDRLPDMSVDVVYGSFCDHVVTPLDDPAELNPFRRIGFRRERPQELTKVAFRWHPDVRIHPGNHDVDHPSDRVGVGLEVRHFPYRSFEQLARKVRQGVAACDAQNVPEVHYSHWRDLAALNDEALAAAWDAMMNEPGLVFDPCI